MTVTASAPYDSLDEQIAQLERRLAAFTARLAKQTPGYRGGLRTEVSKASHRLRQLKHRRDTLRGIKPEGETMNLNRKRLNMKAASANQQEASWPWVAETTFSIGTSDGGRDEYHRGMVVEDAGKLRNFPVLKGNKISQWPPHRVDFSRKPKHFAPPAPSTPNLVITFGETWPDSVRLTAASQPGGDESRAADLLMHTPKGIQQNDVWQRIEQDRIARDRNLHGRRVPV